MRVPCTVGGTHPPGEAFPTGGGGSVPCRAWWSCLQATGTSNQDMNEADGSAHCLLSLTPTPLPLSTPTPPPAQAFRPLGPPLGLFSSCPI